MKSAILLFLILTVTACVVNQDATEYNALREVPMGDNANFQTQEDTDLVFEYELPENDEIPLELNIAQQAKNGLIHSCGLKEFNKFECRYTPNANFYGSDFAIVKAKDGDLLSNESAKIQIDVSSVADAPTAYNGSAFGPFSAPIEFVLPAANDPDSLSTDLQYQITNLPDNGSLNCSGRNCTYQANSDFIGADELQYKVVDEGSASSEIATVDIMVSPEDAIETFTQGVSGVQGADIVWVVDNSGSMENEQQTLAANFDSFANNLVHEDGSAKFDFNMGVIATDAYLYGSSSNSFQTKSSGNAYDLSSSKASQSFEAFKNEFSEAALVGIGGSGKERAFQSMDRSYFLNPSFYGGDDRLLVYIILTDEEEQSCYATRNTTGSQISLTYSSQSGSNADMNSWYALLTSWKDDADKVKVFPIIRESHDDFGRYLDIANKTGTQVSSIYSSFDSILNQIGSEISQLVNSFTIGNGVNVVQDSVKVYINNVELQSGWSLNNKSIVFDTPPAESSTIKVTYKYY